MVKAYVFLTALLISLTLLYLELTQQGMSSALNFSTWVPMVLCAAIILYSRSLVIFSPIFILYNLVLFGNSIRYIVLSLNQNDFRLRFTLSNLNLNEFESGSQIFALGVIAMCAGYLASKIWPEAKKRIQDKKSVQFKPFLFWVCCVGFFSILVLYLLQTGFSTDFSAKRVLVDRQGNEFRFGPLRFALNIAVIFFQFLLVYAFLNKNMRHRNIIFGISILFILIFAITLSKRSTLLISFMPIALIIAHKFKFTKSHQYILGTFLTISLVLFISSERKNTVNNVNASAQIPISQLTKELFLSSNFSGLVATAISTVVIDHVPPFKGSTFYIDPVTQFIPRQYWPNKPEELGGRIRQYHQHSGFAPKSFKRGGTAPGLISEAWLNFRIPGVISIMFLYGFAIGLFYRRFITHWIYDDFFVVLYLCYVPILTLNCFGGHFARLVLMSVTFSISAFLVMCLRKTVSLNTKDLSVSYAR